MLRDNASRSFSLAEMWDCFPYKHAYFDVGFADFFVGKCIE